MSSIIRYTITIVAAVAGTGLALALVFAPQPEQIERSKPAIGNVQPAPAARIGQPLPPIAKNRIDEVTAASQPAVPPPAPKQSSPPTFLPPASSRQFSAPRPDAADPKPQPSVAQRNASKGQRVGKNDVRNTKGTGSRERLPRGLKLPSREVLNDMAQSIDRAEQGSRSPHPNLSEPLH